MQSTEFLLSMMNTWAEQLGDKFPLPPEGRCALVRGQILATAKLVTPSSEAPAQAKPARVVKTYDAVSKPNGGAA